MSRTAKYTKSILNALLLGGAVYIALSSPAGARKMIRMLGRELGRRESRRRFFWTVAYLRRKNYIDCKESADGMQLTLTEDGRKKVLSYNLETMSLPKQKLWDGKWRIIAFDIPESRRKGRDALRTKMSELGCIQLQKSLWVWPYECGDEIDFIAEIFGIAKFVHYLVVEKISSEKYLLYRFGLRK